MSLTVDVHMSKDTKLESAAFKVNNIVGEKRVFAVARIGDVSVYFDDTNAIYELIDELNRAKRKYIDKVEED